MSAGERKAGLSADDLRRRFDRAFAAVPENRAEDVESFLGVKIGSEGYALRVREMAGFAAARKIIPLASPVAEMLGLAGIRGSVVPVFSLAALIGYESAQESPRWFVLCGTAEPIALGFRDFDGYLELARSDSGEVEGMGEADMRRAKRAHVRQVVRARGEVRGVIDVPSVVKAIHVKVAAAATIKER
jgi:chemotaxis signal transduction protein